MKDINVIVYTMEGCPHCSDFKEMLKEKKIEFFDRDIDIHEDEYKLFVEVSDNHFIPALLIIEGDGEKNQSFIYVPDENYQTLEEAVQIIENHISNLNVI